VPPEQTECRKTERRNRGTVTRVGVFFSHLLEREAAKNNESRRGRTGEEGQPTGRSGRERRKEAAAGTKAGRGAHEHNGQHGGTGRQEKDKAPTRTQASDRLGDSRDRSGGAHRRERGGGRERRCSERARDDAAGSVMTGPRNE